MNNRWIGMIMALVIAGMVTSVRGGNLDAPAAPTNLASAMWTLNDIYNVLDTRTTNVNKRAGAATFAEPTGLPTNGTMHTLDDIMALVTNRAPVSKTGQKTSYATYDDGWYGTNLGVAWPNPRFTVGASGSATNCVTDNLTGLMWARNANMFPCTTNWGAAVTNCNNLDYGGYTDWRLPNVCELQSLMAFQYLTPSLCNMAGTGHWTENDPFAGVQSDWYWSSTSCNPSYAAKMNVNSSYVSSEPKTSTAYVWPVRGGGQ